MPKAKLQKILELYNIKKVSPLTSEMIHRQTKIVKFVKIDKLMDALGIKPGMTILDIGTGSGQYAYKFAERLKRTGRVFATDIDKDRIAYISTQARSRNLTNLSPVLVNSEGLDEFYTKNEFDLIFLAHAYFLLGDRVNYFKRLKNSLAKNGQLVVLAEKDFPKFSLGDISDLGGLIKQLSSEKFESFFYSHLRKSTQELLQQPLDRKTKELLRKVIIEDFNRMMEDTGFLSSFLKDGLTFKKEIAFTREERDFVSWYLRYLKLEDKVLDDIGALDISNRNITYKHLLFIRIINTVLIVQKFRKYLYNGKPAPYLSKGCGNLLNECVIQELSLAGYSLKHKYDFIPFLIILVFTSDKNTEGIR
jgi:ubiquinone/menaquinone biosynthesis C-methylase UbiE